MIWQSKATSHDFPQSNWTVSNNEEYFVHNSVTRLVQFSLGRLPTMSSITQKTGARWDRINTDNYVNKVGKDNALQREVMMTASHQYEKAHIQLITTL